MNKNQLQQGDVLLKRVDKLPPSSVLAKKDPRGIVLAEGENTGHMHFLEPHPDLKLYKIDDLLFLENATKKPVEVVHQEHKPFTVDPGIWQISQVREYDYLQQMERTVID